MSSEDWTLAALIGLPVLAAVCLGMVVRAFVDNGGSYWVVWVFVLALVCVTWGYVFRLPP